jgi:KTSC domain
MSSTIVKVPVEPITSSNLAGIGYDRERQILAVQFKSGAIFHYGNVDLDLATAFYTAGSRGSYYARNIKGKLPGLRVTGPCEKCGREGYLGDTCEECGCGQHREPVRQAAS